MIIDNIRDEIVDGTRQLSADIHFESSGQQPVRFWLRRSGPEVPFQRPGDMLLVAFLLPSMALGERLRITEAVSSDLAATAVDNSIAPLRKWFPRLSAPVLECELQSPAPLPERKITGALFSGGVDSWDTLVRQQHNVDALVHFQGFEIIPAKTAAWNAAHTLVKSVAQDFSKTVLTVGTNLTQIIREKVEERAQQPWPHFSVKVYQGHGGVARALALRGIISGIYVPGSYARDAEMCGSHPDIEEGLATLAFEVMLDGIDSTRLEKIATLLEQRPGFINELRVCVSDTPPDQPPLNCGGCVKCVRTAMELRVSGAKNYAAMFANVPILRQARLQRFFTDPTNWRLLAERAAAVGDTEVRDAVLMLTGEKYQFKRALLRLPNTWRRLKRKLAG